MLVSERTARAACGFAFASRGALELRGRREPVRAFRLTGRVGSGDAPPARLAAPMVGREAELDVLDSIYARAADEGRPHVVTVYGDAGVGKSRLVAEFLERVQDRAPAPLVLRGRCLPYGDGVTYWPLAEMLKAHAGIQDTDSTVEALAKIERVAADLPGAVDVAGADAARLAALLAYTMGVPDLRSPVARNDPQEVRRRVHLAWRAFFTSLADGGPGRSCSSRTSTGPIRRCSTCSTSSASAARDRSCSSIRRAPTWPPSAPGGVAAGATRWRSLSTRWPPPRPGAWLGLLLSVDDLPVPLYERILERAEGNPFFLEEILRRLIDEGLIRREGERWRAAPGIETIELPDSVQGVLASRIDLLAPADKHVLQAAAVVGRVFWREPLRLLTAGLLGGPPAESRRRRATGRARP